MKGLETGMRKKQRMSRLERDVRVGVGTEVEGTYTTEEFDIVSN